MTIAYPSSRLKLSLSLHSCARVCAQVMIQTNVYRNRIFLFIQKLMDLSVDSAVVVAALDSFTKLSEKERDFQKVYGTTGAYRVPNYGQFGRGQVCSMLTRDTVVVVVLRITWKRSLIPFGESPGRLIIALQSRGQM